MNAPVPSSSPASPPHTDRPQPRSAEGTEIESTEQLKRAAGRAAAERVETGMRVGLGTGSTVAHFLHRLGERLALGELADVIGVPTSLRTEQAALELGIPLGTLEEVGILDLTVDGADEVDRELRLIKGMGGALLREKMVAQASDRMLVIAHESKRVERLGQRSPLPVEVVPFGHRSHIPWLEALGARPVVRTAGGDDYRTDNGNVIIDCRFPAGIADPVELDRCLAARAGIVESGLFLGLATEALIASAEGVRSLHRSDP